MGLQDPPVHWQASTWRHVAQAPASRGTPPCRQAAACAALGAEGCGPKQTRPSCHAFCERVRGLARHPSARARTRRPRRGPARARTRAWSGCPARTPARTRTTASASACGSTSATSWPPATVTCAAGCARRAPRCPGAYTLSYPRGRRPLRVGSLHGRLLAASSCVCLVHAAHESRSVTPGWAALALGGACRPNGAHRQAPARQASDGRGRHAGVMQCGCTGLCCCV